MRSALARQLESALQLKKVARPSLARIHSSDKSFTAAAASPGRRPYQFTRDIVSPAVHVNSQETESYAINLRIYNALDAAGQPSSVRPVTSDIASMRVRMHLLRVRCWPRLVVSRLMVSILRTRL